MGHADKVWLVGLLLSASTTFHVSLTTSRGTRRSRQNVRHLYEAFSLLLSLQRAE